MRPLLLLLGLIGSSAWAHPSADAHLHATRDADCSDPVVFQRRVQALTDDGRLARAMQEVEAGRTCGVPAPELDLAQAHVALAAGEAQEALDLTDSRLHQEPRHAGLLRLRARAHEQLGDPQEASNSWLSLARVAGSSPQPWLHAARLRTASGQAAEAAAILEEGLVHTGPLPTLSLACARAHHDAGNPDRAHQLLEGLPATAEVWLMRAALTNNPEEARRCIEQARVAVESWRDSPRKHDQLAAIHTTLENL